MRIETIPFKIFMTPNTGILSSVDGGLVFFIGLSAAIIVLITLEKLGVRINEKLVRLVAYSSLGLGFVALCWKMVLLFG
ncbi:hypothetical protein [Neobacillus vireti]|uniref:hypothetical protein n=1 Tax=Neobacillus vireti TaxID=220686 RepID=UPI002FFDED58